MNTVAIAYFSGFGHTARFAAAVEEGAASVPGTRTHLVAVDALTEEDWLALDEADAIVFGSPTYLGDIAAKFKAFMEQTSGRWKNQEWNGKLAGGFVNSGAKSGDKLHALQSLNLFAAQHGMVWVSLGLLPGWNSSLASEFDLNRLGFWLGAAAQSNGDEGPEAAHPSDLATARHLGVRVAGQAARTRHLPQPAAA
ncbi:flavodoxin family protein [Yinghuangia seranimata]|uniref:flavodoxin family protein n=1 Tax=Yinghuangia seranimata TaxID=408067 RepID=UPI00248CDCE1|nr:flavodoxin family protein [Yinghuangia seranimata]MDI2124542.1 flavodoxin family protein [Yinghuangia seranimata]